MFETDVRTSQKTTYAQFKIHRTNFIDEIGPSTDISKLLYFFKYTVAYHIVLITVKSEMSVKIKPRKMAKSFCHLPMKLDHVPVPNFQRCKYYYNTFRENKILKKISNLQ